MSGVVGNVASGFNSTLGIGIIVIAVIVGAVLVIGGGWMFWYTKKRYNLDVEIKVPRSDGRITLGEWGRGLFNSKRGVVLIKRPKLGAVPMKVMDIKKYLQGANLLTVIQVGPEDYRPVVNDSWTESIVEYEDAKTGKVIEQKEAIMNIRVDTGEYKAWKTSWDSASKRAYSLQSFMQQFQVPISIAIVLISVFVGFAIIWTKVGK